MTNTDSTNTGNNPKKPMKLHLVFILGFVASVAVVAGLAWLYAAYETANLWPWSAEPRLSQDKLFEILRNAVTTAAALGVGITLFFSYRRQQTAEETQRIGAEAQQTAARAQAVAAAALQLSTQQHDLDQQRRQDAITSGLRDRYANAAQQLGSEHLAVRLAGIYSLAALADDWAEIDNKDERQVCIDLLCAYFRSQSDENIATRKELVDATFQVVKERLAPDETERKFWGSTRIRLAKPGLLPLLGPLCIESKGVLTIDEALILHRRVRDVQINGGRFRLTKIRAIRQVLAFFRGRVTDGGRIEIDVQPPAGGDQRQQTPPNIRFQAFTVEKGMISIVAEGAQVTFSGCVFEVGAALDLDVAGHEGPHRGHVYFKGCTFRTNVFGDDENWEPGEDLYQLHTDFLTVDRRCKFENGAPELESFTPSQRQG